MAKSKQLKLRPGDRVVGVQAREKRDLFAGCNEPGKQWFHPDAHVFMKTFCRICKNVDCTRAQGSVSPWQTRMSEQADYLLNDPQFSDLTTPEHLRFAEQAFNDIGQKMIRLDIARHRQDWEIPEGPTDGFDKVASPDTTDQFDEAVKKLAQARGKEEPDFPKSETREGPTHFQEESTESENLYEYDTQYPSSSGKKTYHVILHKTGRWTCECAGFKNLKKCKHLDTVRAWYADQLLQNEEAEKQQAISPPTPVKPASPVVPQQDPRLPPVAAPFNTPMPHEGVMVGGAESSTRPDPKAPQDSWAISKDQVVEHGATVTMKVTKKP